MKEMARAITEVFDEFGLHKRVQQARAMDLWADACGREMADKTRAERVGGGVLFVKVANSAWAQELVFHKSRLREKINGVLGGDFIEDIHFTVGDFAQQETAYTEDQGLDYRQEWRSLDLSPSDKEAVSSAVELVSDPRIAQALQGFLEDEKRRRKWRIAQGWTPCSCGGLIPPDEEVCVHCHRLDDGPAASGHEKVIADPEQKVVRQHHEGSGPNIRGILQEAPWLDYRQVCAILPGISEEEFSSIHSQLLEELEGALARVAATSEGSAPDGDLEKVCTNVMMRVGKPPDEIDFATAAEVLGSDVAAKVFCEEEGSFGGEGNGFDG